MKILTASSVDFLRKEVKDFIDIRQLTMGQLVEKYDSIKTLSVDYEIGVPSVELDKPVLNGEEDSSEENNCRKLYEAMSGLKPSEATDERLWVTLCLDQHRDYCLARWPKTNSDNVKYFNHILNHWFTMSSRGRLRDNAISRLWWMAKISNRAQEYINKDVLKLLFSYPADYRNNLFGRSSSANSPMVVAAIIEVTEMADKLKTERKPFRRFMKDVNYLGKRCLLPSFDFPILVGKLYDLYRKSQGKDTNG